MSIIYVNCV